MSIRKSRAGDFAPTCVTSLQDEQKPKVGVEGAIQTQRCRLSTVGENIWMGDVKASIYPGNAHVIYSKSDGGSDVQELVCVGRHLAA